MDTSDGYYAVSDKLLEHPGQFTLDHVLDFMKILNDDCYQPSFLDTIIKIIHNMVCHEYGLFWNIRYLIEDDSVYPLVKEALVQISPNGSKFVLQFLGGKYD